MGKLESFGERIGGHSDKFWSIKWIFIHWIFYLGNWHFVQFLGNNSKEKCIFLGNDWGNIYYFWGI